MTNSFKSITDVLENNRPALEMMSSSKWVRVFFAGQFIADSKQAALVLQKGRTPVYYFPLQDVRKDVLVATNKTRSFEGLGKAGFWDIKLGEKIAEGAAWSIIEPDPQAAQLNGYIAFKWNSMDAWFEEDEEIFVHPRDPFSRIDVIQSSRNVRIVVNGETVAESNHPVLLFETGLPTRYYISKMDIRMDLLQPSDLHTECPYKGIASYYSVRAGDKIARDIAWYYPFPYPEVAKIQNLISFYDEKVDEVYVDGQKQERPRTLWS